MINRRRFLAWQAAAGVFAPSLALPAASGLEANPGQLMITGFRGTNPSEPEVDQVRRFIESGDVAGVILLRRNIKSPEQLSRLILSLQSSASENPIIVSIDQEGGQVTRLGPYNGFKYWISAADLASSGRNNDEVLSYYAERAMELSDVGVNLNLGPVVDLNINPFNPIIGAKGRAYGRRVEDVMRFAELFIQAHRAVGVKTCLKHFPGHGSSFEDSHTGSADVSQTWSAKEIAPFERLVSAGMAETIMNSHVLNQYLSDEPWIPTSLSKNSVREIREGLAFTGPIITDDMQMNAISDLFTPAEASAKAISVGNSLLIHSNYEEQFSLATVSEVKTAILASMKQDILTPALVADRVTEVSEFRASLTDPR